MRAARPLFILALFSACAAPTSDDDASSTDSAVVGGVETYDHPEIGALIWGNNLCTGTLVQANVVISAAHCFSFVEDQDVSNAQPDYAFEIQKSATSRRRFKIDRIHSIGGYDERSQAWRRGDIALLRLTEAVPANVARPAEVAALWPLPGSTFSIYGFGCTSRDESHPGVGTKRRRDFRGQIAGIAATRALCPGDSGGPLFDPAQGAVLGTNSGYVNDVDQFGDVPGNWMFIQAKLREWR